jgi:hypothetical protein
MQLVTWVRTNDSYAVIVPGRPAGVLNTFLVRTLYLDVFWFIERSRFTIKVVHWREDCGLSVKFWLLFKCVFFFVLYNVLPIRSSNPFLPVVPGSGTPGYFFWGRGGGRVLECAKVGLKIERERERPWPWETPGDLSLPNSWRRTCRWQRNVAGSLSFRLD